ncbi:MAG: prolipoprotein diacylglyceryl transferase [Chitinophagaceae bacterium]|nr:prolipoprotein diacylglyceryl transferase [Chitinophagaceae bacterium]
MYPNLYYAFEDLFGVKIHALKFINTFGFFVAWSFFAAAYVLTRELRRKQRAGLMLSEDTKIIVGKPASTRELLINFIGGFLLGYKMLGLFFADDALTIDPPAYIFSSQGNLPAGILLGLVLAGVKWYEKNKQKLAKPEERTIRLWPHDRVGDMLILALIFGFLGAKVFHNLENWNDFWKNPVDALLSFSGLTFYGGLICAGLAIYFYARKHKIGFRHLCDAFAPALLLAYAIGRIGCQVSGDGDWGIVNTAYISTRDAKVVRADSATVNSTLRRNGEYYKTMGYMEKEEVHRKNFPAPSWMPVWMVAYNYPHNTINEGIPIVDCKGDHCEQLPVPVFPTPFYETVVCLLLTGLLFYLRNKLRIPGTLFAVYLILNGLERFFIEKIRVNTKYDIFGFQPTQAELISSLLVIIGVVLLFVLPRYKPKAA